MAQSDIESALNQILNTSPAFPIAFENVQTDQTGTHYQQQFLPVETDNVSIAFGDAQNLTGIYQVIIAIPLNEGKADSDIGQADLLAKFPRGLQLSYNGQNAEIVKTYIDPSFQNGEWWIIPVSVEYQGFING